MGATQPRPRMGCAWLEEFGGSGQDLFPHHVSICAGSTLIPKLLFVAPRVPLLMETLQGLSGGCGLLHHLPSAGGLIPQSQPWLHLQLKAKDGKLWLYSMCSSSPFPWLQGCLLGPGPFPEQASILLQHESCWVTALHGALGGTCLEMPMPCPFLRLAHASHLAPSCALAKPTSEVAKGPRNLHGGLLFVPPPVAEPLVVGKPLELALGMGIGLGLLWGLLP